MDSNLIEKDMCAQHHRSFLPRAQNRKTDELFDWKASGASRIQSNKQKITVQQRQYFIHSLYESGGGGGERERPEGLQESIV